MHGGCTATILDGLSEIYCPQLLYLDIHLIHSVVPLPIPVLLQSEEWKYSGLTSSLSINYYVPASIGERLVVIATTKAGGKRSVTVHGEVSVME